MNQLTFIDKIQVLGKLLFSSPAIIGIFAFSLVLMITLFLSNKLNKKIIKYVFIGIYVALIGFTIFKYGSNFITSIDSFITLFMANLYFPTIPIYVVILIISFIIMIFTLGSKKNSKLIKIINTVFFTLIQMLFAIFIFIVESNNIDVSSNENIYTNEQTLTLLELGMGLFIVWMIVIFVIYYLKKADKIFKTKKSETQDDFDEYINDYNEPTKKVETNKNTFNNNVVQNLVPEFNLNDSTNEEIISFDNYDNSTNNIGIFNNSNSENKTNPTTKTDVFNNFDFIDIPKNKVDRKNEDVEIIDFDL